MRTPKLKWKRGTYKTDAGAEVPAYFFGPFAAVKGVSRWDTRHAPTKLELGRGCSFKLLKQAKAYIEELATIPADWTSPNPQASCTPEVIELVRPIYFRHKAIAEGR